MRSQVEPHQHWHLYDRLSPRANRIFDGATRLATRRLYEAYLLNLTKRYRILSAKPPPKPRLLTSNILSSFRTLKSPDEAGAGRCATAVWCTKAMTGHATPHKQISRIRSVNPRTKPRLHISAVPSLHNEWMTVQLLPQKSPIAPVALVRGPCGILRLQGFCSFWCEIDTRGFSQKS